MCKEEAYFLKGSESQHMESARGLQRRTHDIQKRHRKAKAARNVSHMNWYSQKSFRIFFHPSWELLSPLWWGAFPPIWGLSCKLCKSTSH